MTKSEFARHLNRIPAYVTDLLKADRLVMAPDGKRILVDASIERIKATASMAHQGVADRHAAARAAADGAEDDPEALAAAPSPEQIKYQSSRAEREHWNAQAARRDYEVSMRHLLPAAEVETSIAHAVTQLRARLETLPDILAPQLAAEPDESKCRSLLADEIEHALTELARGFNTVAKADVA